MKKIFATLMVGFAAFYVVVTQAENNTPTSVKVNYDMHDTDGGGDVVSSQGSVSFQYPESDKLVKADRIQNVQDQFTSFAQFHMKRARSAKDDKNDVATALVGLRVDE